MLAREDHVERRARWPGQMQGLLRVLLRQRAYCVAGTTARIVLPAKSRF